MLKYQIIKIIIMIDIVNWEIKHKSTSGSDNYFWDVWAFGDTVYVPSKKGLIKESISTGDLGIACSFEGESY